MKSQDAGEPELFRGEGMATGIVIGATRRVQVLVQDKEADKPTAYSLDEMCVIPSDEDVATYTEHHKKLRTLVDEHNTAQKQREKDKIAEVDAMNAAIFGQPLDV